MSIALDLYNGPDKIFLLRMLSFLFLRTLHFASDTSPLDGGPRMIIALSSVLVAVSS